MSASLASRIAETLRQHSWHEARMQCVCGEDGGVGDFEWTEEGWSDHAAALVLALFEPEWRIRWHNSTTVMPAADAEVAWELQQLYRGRKGYVESRIAGPWEPQETP